MALELLAGPFTVTDRASGAPVGASISGTAIWLDGVGIALPISSAGIYLVQLDGSAYWIAEGSHFEYGLVLEGASADATGRAHAYGIARTHAFDPGEWSLDPITRVRGARFGASYPGLGSYARLHDRYLEPIGDSVFWRPLDLSASSTRELRFTGLAAGAYAEFFSWGDGADELIVGCTNGQFVRYDWVAKQQRGAAGTLGMACVGLWYSARLRVFVSLHFKDGTPQTLETRVWARTPAPASVSAPQASPAPQAGRRSTVTATVTGAHGEPCPGEVVAWSLAGPGSLALGATESNAAGIATTYYDAPLAATGAAEITAEVAY